MRKEPTVPIGPGLFRIYSMRVKPRIPFWWGGGWGVRVGVNDALIPSPPYSYAGTSHTPAPPPTLWSGRREKQRRQQKSAVFGYCELCEWKCGAEHRLSNTPSVFQPELMQQWLNMQMCLKACVAP